MRCLPFHGSARADCRESTDWRENRCSRSVAWLKLAVCVLAVGLAVSPVLAQPLFRSGFLSFAIHGYTEWVALGDVNRDGHLDFAAPNRSNRVVYLGLGRGDGTFAAIAELDISPRLTATLADINQDGKLDLLCPGDAGIVVRLGNGDGTFGPKQIQWTFLSGNFSASTAIADLNQDGKGDLLVGHENKVQAWLSHGDGTFEPPIESPIAAVGEGDAIGVALGDVDGDSRADALVANSTGASQPLFLRGRGDGSFGPPVPIGPYETGTHVAVGDVNQDGNADVLCGRTVYLGHGDGAFDAVRPFEYARWPYFELFTAADVNGDGDPDLVAGADSLVVVALGNGDGTFQPERTFPSCWILHASVGDFDGDSHTDVLARGSTGWITLHLGNGDGTFGAVNDFGTGQEPWAVAIADVSGDGRGDILTANRVAGSVSVLFGDGAGGFPSRSDFAAGAGARSLAVADLNRDGRPDVVTANRDANGVSALLNQGGGAFGPAQNYLMGTTPVGVGVADFNGDGHLDVITANETSANVTVRLGDGAGGLGASRSFAMDGAGVGPAIADMNNDLRPDVVTGRSILLGDGAGGFVSRYDFAGALGAVAVGDVNGDGRPDVVSSGYFASQVHLGNGDGTLQSPMPMFLTNQVKASALSDVNRDGRLDFVVTNQYGGSASVHLGNGDGTFGVPVGYGGNVLASGVGVGDVNGDGAPDLALASWTSSVVSVFLNVAGGPVPALPTLVSAEAEPGLVRLIWQGVAGRGLVATVYRRDLDHDWSALGTVAADASGRLVFEDRDVIAGTTYDYRLGTRDGVEEVFFGHVTVVVPQGYILALAGLRPNPAGRDLVAAFSLPAKGPALLEVFDLAGRRVLVRDVGELDPGNHVANLQPDRRLAPGLYLLRLTSGGQTLTAKGVVAR